MCVCGDEVLDDPAMSDKLGADFFGGEPGFRGRVLADQSHWASAAATLRGLFRPSGSRGCRTQWARGTGVASLLLPAEVRIFAESLVTRPRVWQRVLCLGGRRSQPAV